MWCSGYLAGGGGDVLGFCSVSLVMFGLWSIRTLVVFVTCVCGEVVVVVGWC